MEDAAKHLFDSEAERGFFFPPIREASHQPDLLVCVHAANVKLEEGRKPNLGLTTRACRLHVNNLEGIDVKHLKPTSASMSSATVDFLSLDALYICIY